MKFIGRHSFATATWLLLLTAAASAGAQDVRPEETTHPPQTAPTVGGEPVAEEEGLPVSSLEAERQLPVRIDEIEVHHTGGLWKTQDLVVDRELAFKKGEVVTVHQWRTSLMRLWNTQIFARVDARIETRKGKKVAIFDLQDRWSLIPLFEFHYGGHATWFMVGASEHNLLGRYLQADVFYEYFDGENGGLALFRDPRFLDERLELKAILGRTVRPRPEYTVQRTRAFLSLLKLEYNDRVRFGASLDVFNDHFLPPVEKHGESRPLPKDMQTAVFEPSIRFGRVDVRRFQQDGYSLEARPALGVTLSQGVLKPYAQVVVEALLFDAYGDRFSLAARLRAGTQSPVVEDQLEFWLGGLDTIRGYRDNFVRTQAYALANLEARYIAFDTDWLACQAALFVDASLSLQRGGTRVGTLSAGPGLRFFIPKLVDSELRIDLAIPLVNAPREFDWAIGTEPFF